MIRDRLRRLARRVLDPGPVPAAGESPPPPTPPPPARAKPARDDDLGDLDIETSAPLATSLVLDIREPREFATGVAPGTTLLPMDLVPHHLADLPRDRPVTVVCAHGVRSLGVAHYLREMGFSAASLAGGIHALGGALAQPPGAGPGTRVLLPAALAGTADDLAGEVIQQVGERVQVRVRDPGGAWVRLEVPLDALTPG
jgi:rhodanese-related sulfurtransferase